MSKHNLGDLDYIQHYAERYDSNPYFFSPGAMRVWNSRVSNLTRIGGGRGIQSYRFITSEKMDHDSPRRYTVRSATVDHNRRRVDIDAVSDFQEYATLREAKRHLRDGLPSELGWRHLNCAIYGENHSADRVQVYTGRPHVSHVCGYHADRGMYGED